MESHPAAAGAFGVYIPAHIANLNYSPEVSFVFGASTFDLKSRLTVLLGLLIADRAMP
jgi:hypothetical protein